jgi:hypothetical protein
MRAAILVSTTFLCLLAGASTDSPEPVGYFDASPVPLEGRPWMMAAGDLDGDGLVDLVTADPREAEFVVHRQSRGPTSYRFDATTVATTGFDPDGIFVAHLDGDDRLDVLVFDDWRGVAVVYRNRGGLTFDPVVTEVADQWDHVDLADADGDGDLDLVYESTALPGIGVLENDGQGGFTKRRLLDTGRVHAPFRMGDVNGDGRPDLVLQRFLPGSRVEVLLATEDGFAEPIVVDAYPYRDLRLADLDGDGDLDIAMARQGAGTPPEGCRVLLGNGDGTFGDPTQYDMPANGSVVVRRNLWTVDVDEDGDLDLLNDVVVNNVSILLNRGDGTFGKPHEIRLDPLTEMQRVHGLAVFHLGGDPRPDILAVASTHTAGTLSELPVLYELDRGGPAPPSISGLSETTIRAGDTRTLEVTGERFDLWTTLRLDDGIAVLREEVLSEGRMTVTVQPDPVGIDDPYLRHGFDSAVVVTGLGGGQRLDGELHVTPFWDFGMRTFVGRLRDRSKRRGDRFKARATSEGAVRDPERFVRAGEDLRIEIGTEGRFHTVKISGDDPRWRRSGDGRRLSYRSPVFAKPWIRFRLDIRSGRPAMKLKVRRFDFPEEQTADVWVRVFLGATRFASRETWSGSDGRYRVGR